MSRGEAPPNVDKELHTSLGDVAPNATRTGTPRRGRRTLRAGLQPHGSFGEAEGFSLSFAKQALNGNLDDVIQTVKRTLHLGGRPAERTSAKSTVIPLVRPSAPRGRLREASNRAYRASQ